MSSEPEEPAASAAYDEETGEDAHAYVLRLRVDRVVPTAPGQSRLRLVEVRSNKIWNFRSLDQALARLRSRLGAILRRDARLHDGRARQLRR